MSRYIDGWIDEQIDIQAHDVLHISVEITINCETLFNPENGEVLLSGTSQGDIATYTCFDGFAIVGVDIRYCQNDGRWTGREPLCRRK